MNLRVIHLVSGFLLVSVLVLTASCKPPKIHWADPPPPPKPAVAVAPVVAPPKTVPALPPSGQILRDAEAEIGAHIDELRDHMRPLAIEVVEADKYEKDMAASVTKMKLNYGATYRVIAQYQRQGSFWRLVSITGRIR